MAKAINFETLPREIRAALYRIDDPQTFTVERFNQQAITVINTRISRVYKAVRRNKRLIAAFDREIDNLILLRNKKIASPTPFNRQQFISFEMIALLYIDGEIVVGNALPKHAAQLAEAQHKLHVAFEKDAKNKLAEWNSARVLKPVFAKANAEDFSADFIKYARALQRELKAYELSRDDMTFIHSDSHLSNVVYQPERAVLIDWAQAGWGSKFFELGVTIHALMAEKKAMHRELIAAYVAAYFGEAGPSERDLELIDLHVKLRYLEQATWHLSETKDDQLLHRPKILRLIEESLRKAQKFSLSGLLR